MSPHSMNYRRLAERLEIHYTHGSWLNMAEIELSVLTTWQMQAEVTAWQNDRNNSANKIQWQFTTSDARIKLKKLYPKI
jgi:hypothetical protein